MITYFEKHNKLSWLITILIAITIFYISSLTFPPSSQTGSFSLKPILYHFLAFFGLAFFLLISLTKGKNKSLIFPAILIAIAYGITDELHQYFVPGRYLSISDVLIDTTGIIFATLIYTIRIQSKKIFT